MEETKDTSFRFMLGAQTNVGCSRTNNEDNFVVNADLSSGEWLLPRDGHTSFDLGNKGAILMVADGMGGLDAGEIASLIAVETIKEFFSPAKITDEIVETDSTIQKYMREAIIAADCNIKKRSCEEQDIKSMGTTIVVVWLFDGYANIAWCGDSRAYLFHPVSGLAPVTKDHSYVQDLVDSGRLLPEFAFDHPDSNIITRSLGNPQKGANPDFVRFRLQENELLLLCTDGLNSMLRDEEIESILQETSNEIDICTKALIQGALKAGGHDNVTVVLCRIASTEEGSGVEMQQTVSSFAGKSKKKTTLSVLLRICILLLTLSLLCLVYLATMEGKWDPWKSKIIHWYEQTVK